MEVARPREMSALAAPRAATSKRTAALAGLVMALGLVLTLPLPLIAAGPLRAKPDPYQATTSREARHSAVTSIPLDKLDASARAKVSSVLSDVSFFRRMPVRVVQCDPDYYLFLVEHPDVVVNIWQVLGINKMQMRQLGPDKYYVTDAAGTTGTVEYLYSSHNTHLIYSEGTYNGPLFARPAQGRGLLILKTGYVREPNGRYYITSRLDAFMQVEHVGAELLTKTFQPLVGRVADINFTYTTGFLGNLSRTAESHLRWHPQVLQRGSEEHRLLDAEALSSGQGIAGSEVFWEVAWRVGVVFEFIPYEVE